MSVSFNLIREPWIPCLQADGAPTELSLRDTLARAHELREVAAGNPLETAAIYRLLLALLHRVYGPPAEEAWCDLWEARRWDMRPLDAYLSQWQGRFDLFSGEHPFLQRPDGRVRPKSVSSLLPDVASGNNSTLFDHHVEDSDVLLSPAAAACALLGALSFGLAGLSGLPAKFTDAPCARGPIFLAEGDTLFETLCLSLTRYPTEPDSPGDRPAWEVDDPTAPARDRPLGVLDQLTWPNRSILLLPEEVAGRLVVRQMTMAPALVLHPDILDPMKSYRIDEKRGHLVLRFTEDRALWRDVGVLLGRQSTRPPRVSVWLRELAAQGYLHPPERRLRFIALGMANDQAKINFMRSERVPLSIACLTQPMLVDVIQESLRLAEETSRQLWGATHTLARLVIAPESDLDNAHQPAREDVAAITGQWAVERHYWSRLELPFRELLAALPADAGAARLSWRHTLRGTSWEALEVLCRSLEQDLRRLKAVVRARDQLASGLHHVLGTVGGDYTRPASSGKE
jgi:CRISPR system Cascade subunit CasA